MVPLKIVFIVTTVDGYGADKSMLYNIVELKKTGKIEPLVIIPNKGYIEEDLVKEGISYYICNYKSWTKGYKLRFLAFLKPALKRTANYFLAWRIFKKHLSKQNIQLVHTNTFTTDFGMLLSKILKVKHIMHIREIPYEQFNFVFEYPEKKIYNWVAESSSLVLCNSKYTYNYFSDKIDRKLTLIPNPVFRLNEPLIKNDKEKNKVRFIVAGRYESSKNQWDVLKAVRQLVEESCKNFEVHVFGDGPLKNDYETYIKSQALNEFVFLHHYQKNLFHTICKFDVGIVSSQFEAFGRITIEYMVNGLPVIGNDTGNTPYLIQDGCNGFIYQFRNPDDLAMKMKMFLDGDRFDLIEKMGANARESVNEEYSIEKSSVLLYDSYLDCFS